MTNKTQCGYKQDKPLKPDRNVGRTRNGYKAPSPKTKGKRKTVKKV